MLIETAGRRILTDPYLGSRGNPAYARPDPPHRTRAELKEVDLVLVSHNHRDHTDSRFFRSLAGDVPVVAPRATTWFTRLKSAHNVVGPGIWQQQQFGPVRVTAVPASHIVITRGFLVEAEGKTVYFAGDTYYRGFMKEIGSGLTLDLALLPVATFRIPMTMGERGAVRAVRSLSPRVVIPIHPGLHPRSPLARRSESPEGFQKRLQNAGLNAEVRFFAQARVGSADGPASRAPVRVP